MGPERPAPATYPMTQVGYTAMLPLYKKNEYQLIRCCMYVNNYTKETSPIFSSAG